MISFSTTEEHVSPFNKNRLRKNINYNHVVRVWI